jgi:transposase
VLTDGRGVPIGVAVSGANVHDQRLVNETLQNIPIRRPRPTKRKKQHLCADKGYDADSVRSVARHRRYVAHIPKKGESPKLRRRRRGRARRWVVERTQSWLNRARRLLIRWEKKAANYLGFLHLQFAITVLQSAGVLG